MLAVVRSFVTARTSSRIRHIGYCTSKAFLVGFILWALVSVWGEWRNADWLGYEMLYLSDGGWLADQSRDPAFLALLDASRQILDYESFRVAIACYFLAFTVWFARAWRSRGVNDTYFLSFAPLLPLLYPRFTVQIREGIAITLILAALTIYSARLERSRRSGLLPAILMALAAALHGATSLFLLLVYLPRVAGHSVGRFGSILGGAVGLGLVGGLFGFGVLNNAVLSLSDSLWSGAQHTATEVSDAKRWYWLARCGLVGFIVWLAKTYAGVFDPHTARSLRLGAYAVLPLMQFVTIWLIFNEFDSVLASAAIRLLNMVLLVLLAILSLKARKRLPLLIVTAFLLYDQHRVMLTFDGDAG